MKEDPADLLDQARKAWKAEKSASREMNRLKQYRRMTPGMKEDFSEQCDRNAKAIKTLEEILGAVSK